MELSIASAYCQNRKQTVKSIRVRWPFRRLWEVGLQPGQVKTSQFIDPPVGVEGETSLTKWANVTHFQLRHECTFPFTAPVLSITVPGYPTFGHTR